MVCWFELDDEVGETVLKVYDLDRGNVEKLDVAWPDDTDIKWEDCTWLDDETIGVRGFTPDEESHTTGLTTLHILKIRRLPRTCTWLLRPLCVSSSSRRSWRPCEIDCARVLRCRCLRTNLIPMVIRSEKVL